MPHFNIAMSWEVYSHQIIEARDLDEAIRIMEEEAELPRNY